MVGNNLSLPLALTCSQRFFALLFGNLRLLLRRLFGRFGDFSLMLGFVSSEVRSVRFASRFFGFSFCNALLRFGVAAGDLGKFSLTFRNLRLRLRARSLRVGQKQKTE